MTITNISKFIDALSKIKKVDFHEFFYRGHSDTKYELKPNLYRKENFYVNEDKIYREAIINNPQEFYNCHSTIEVLVKMQHYGIPTRLLDVTRNPLIALYFACRENPATDGEIVLLNIPIKNIKFFDSDRISILSNLAKQQVDFGYDYKKDFNYKKDEDVKEVNNEYFGYLLHSIKEDKPHFYDIIDPRHLEQVFAVQVKLDNPRIIRQNGAFLLFGIQKSIEGINGKTNCSIINPDWVLKPKKEKLIIPKEHKNTIIEELNLLGINYSTLFPELDDFASFIKEKYKH